MVSPESLEDEVIIDDASSTNDFIDGDKNKNINLQPSLTDNSERTLGILVLLTVPLAWGTYAPVVKYMYEKIDPAMPGFVFSAGYYVVAAVSLGILSYYRSSKEEIGSGQIEALDASDVNGDTNDLTTLGGWELGSYLFIGNGLQVVGLQTVPADRAAFLVQLTTVLVPLFFAISEGTLSAVPLPTWIACVVAFTGVIVMGADDKAGGGESISANVDSVNLDINQLVNLHISQGDFLIVLAAVAYTMHVVRLGAYAPKTTPLKLAASKAVTEAFLSVVLLITLTVIGTTHMASPQFVSETANSVSEYFTTITSTFMDSGLEKEGTTLGVSIAAILWTGWITCAYTIYAQSFGQKRVNPTDSNLIYTTQPLFSSLFAFFLLGETLGVYGYFGAAMIGTALWLVSSNQSA